MLFIVQLHHSWVSLCRLAIYILQLSANVLNFIMKLWFFSCIEVVWQKFSLHLAKLWIYEGTFYSRTFHIWPVYIFVILFWSFLWFLLFSYRLFNRNLTFLCLFIISFKQLFILKDFLFKWFLYCIFLLNESITVIFHL